MGPWVQGDDHYREQLLNPQMSRWFRYAGPGTVNDLVEAGWGDASDTFPFTDEMMRDLFGVPYPASTYTYVTGAPGFEIGMSQYSPAVYQFETPESLIDPSAPLEIPEIEWPPGAVGYEWESPTGIWVQEDFTLRAEVSLTLSTAAAADAHPMHLLMLYGGHDLGDENAFPRRSELRRFTPPPDPRPPGWVSPDWQDVGTPQPWPRTPSYASYIELSTEFNGVVVADGEVIPRTISLLPVPDYVLRDDALFSGVVDARLTVGVRRGFRPPRHRFIYHAGLRRLRQRQTLPGADSWPLRQRQNGGHSGSWSLRQRQSGV